MKILITLILTTFILSLNNCSKKPEAKEVKTEETTVTTIKENISFVSAKILEMKKQSDTLYNLKLQILSSTSDDNLPNFAQVGEEISAKPRFILDENNSINLNETRNKNLIELSRQKPGDVVNLTLIRTLKEGWLIIDFQK